MTSKKSEAVKAAEKEAAKAKVKEAKAARAAELDKPLEGVDVKGDGLQSEDEIAARGVDIDEDRAVKADESDVIGEDSNAKASEGESEDGLLEQLNSWLSAMVERMDALEDSMTRVEAMIRKANKDKKPGTHAGSIDDLGTIG